MKKIYILLICSALMLFGQSWNRVLEEYVGGILLAGAYSGSVNYSKPFFVDIDDDNDFDFFIGGEHGGLHYYRNDGTASTPDWTFITEFYQSIDVDNRSTEAFVDIDNDGDYDLFIGEQDGNINYYRNDGTPASADFTFITDNYASISVGSFSAPIFCDIDDDNDYDLFIGRQDGKITYYRNDGTVSVPTWTFVSNAWYSIDVATRSIPWFADIDADNDYDLFIGGAEGTVYFYRNDGTPTSPNMVFVTSNYTADVGNTSAPSFVDIDNDGDLDLFIGEYIGNVNWYRNTGTASSPSWSFVRRHYVDIDMNSSSTPTLVDIDNDGDKDLFAGEWVGLIDYYQNSGTTTDHQWTLISENYDSIDVGDNSVPTFVKIDGDNDYDMFIGNLLGNIYYYRNDGSVTVPNFVLVSINYNSIDVGDNAAPVFVDIDNDNDKDMFIGCLNGTIWYYRNDGSSSTPSWTYVSNNYSGIDVGDRSIPRFADLDNDGDFDLFIGEAFGTTYYYRNTGTPSSPSFTLVTSALGGINVEENTCPDFADIDADGDLDLFIGERWGGLNLYLQMVSDVIPPMRPDIVSAVKTSNNVKLTWRKITADTLGNVENMRGYIVYRNTVPSYVPGSTDSVGYVNQPDTIFTNMNVLSSSQNYYYLVKAVDQSNNRSYPSNMGFKFRQALNENATLTDKNWVSLPYRNNYANASDFYTDIGLTVCYGIRKLNPVTQGYTTCWWDNENLEFVDDYPVLVGTGYEVLASVDSAVRVTGAHNPAFRVSLNANASLTDKNWTSIPYNTTYINASNMYSDIGINVCYGIRKLNPATQGYTTCWWDNENLEFVDDYPLIQGMAYEILVNSDTSWRPAVYTNRGTDIVSLPVRERLGTMAVVQEPDWPVSKNNERADVVLYESVMDDHFDAGREVADRQPCLVRGRIKGDVSGLAMRCYVLSRLDELLTENVQSCGIRSGNRSTVWWAELGNLPSPWRAGDEVVVLLSREGYYGAVSYRIDGSQDVVELPRITLNPVPLIDVGQSADGGRELTWQAVNDPLVIGYSVYRISDNQTCERLNDAIIKGMTFTVNNAAIEGRYVLRLVFAGGWESGFYPQIAGKIADGVQSGGDARIPVVFALDQVKPNPFSRQTEIGFAVAQARPVELKVYDVAGKLVRTLRSGALKPGYYSCIWNACDDAGSALPTGVYFVELRTDHGKYTGKMILKR